MKNRIQEIFLSHERNEIRNVHLHSYKRMSIETKLNGLTYFQSPNSIKWKTFLYLFINNDFKKPYENIPKFQIYFGKLLYT